MGCETVTGIAAKEKNVVSGSLVKTNSLTNTVKASLRYGVMYGFFIKKDI